MEHEGLIKWFFSLVGYFNHYAFFTRKLWRDVKGFEKEDEAEIKAAFMHYWFYHKFNVFTCPVGMEWCAEVSEESWYNYIKRFEPVIRAFEKWVEDQR